MSLGEAFRLGVAGGASERRDWAALAVLVAVLSAGVVLGWSLTVGASDAGAPGKAGAGPGLVETAPAAGPWRFAWDQTTRTPEREQASQLEALRNVAAGSAALLSGLALMLLTGLWRQRLRRLEDESFVHFAVGSTRRQRLARAAGEGRPWLVTAAVAAGVAATGVPWAVERSWPGSAELSPPMAAALVAAAAAVALALRWEATRGEHGEDGAMGRIVSSPLAVASGGFAVLSAVAVLVGHVPGSPRDDGAERLVAEVSLPVASAEERGALLEDWVASGPRGFGVASAGAVRGTGHSSSVQVECGACWEGGLPMPLKAVRAEVHAVAPDTFPFLRLSVVEGRDFEPGEGSAPVAIVSRALARRHFQDGEPIGRRVRVGDSPWLEVVGVVSDRPEARDHFEYEVYLPVALAAPTGLEIVTDGAPGVMPRARAGAPSGAVVAEARTMAEVFSSHRWFAGLSVVVGLVTALTVFFGVWVGGRNEARGAVYELALRRAVGASVRELRVRVVAWAARDLAVILLAGGWLSLFLGAGLNAAYGGIPNVDVTAWTLAWAVVGSAFVLSRMPAFRAAARLSPVDGLRGD